MQTIESFIPIQQFRYYYSVLTPAEKLAYWRLLNAFLHHDPEVSFEGLGLTIKQLDYLEDCVNYDVPELLKACKIKNYTHAQGSDQVKWCTLKEELTLEEHTHQLQTCQQQAECIVAQAQQISGGVGKVKVVHDWFIQQCTYDHETSSDASNHNAYGAFALHKSVCEGFSLSARMCFDRLSINSLVVCGYAWDESSPRVRKRPFAGDHAWLMVRAGRRWYHLDLTADLNRSHQKHTNCYDYFLLSDNSATKTHQFNAGLLPHARLDYRKEPVA